MGNSGSSGQLVECYKRYGLVTGAAECRVIGGGVSDLEKYLLPPLSDAKKTLIKDIAETLHDRLKIASLDPKGKTADELVDALKKVIPDPRVGKGNNKTWSDKESHQVKACKVLADMLNERFGSSVVNPEGKVDEVCENVSSIVYSLFTGMQAEFLAVKKDVERVLKNVRVLDEMLETNYNFMIEKINADKDSNLAGEVNILREVHKDTKEELDRQRKILENILDVVIKPYEADLEELSRDNVELKNLVSKIKKHPGTKEFGQKIAFMLSGLKTVAAAAKAVDYALNKAGISFQEYAKVSTPKDLKKLLNDKAVEKLNEPESALEHYMRARNTLFNTMYMHDDIVEQLRQVKGRGEEPEPDVEGGADSVVGGLRLDKKVYQRQQLKKALLKTFNSRVSGLVDIIIRAAKQISNSVMAKQLKLTDNLDKFVRALDELPNINKKYMYMALAGYTDTIEARQDREKFISQVKHIVATINLVLAENQSEAFKDMKTGFEELIKVVEVFSNKFAEGFGAYRAARGQGEDGGAESDARYLDPEEFKKIMAYWQSRQAANAPVSEAPPALPSRPAPALPPKPVPDANAPASFGSTLASTATGALTGIGKAASGIFKVASTVLEKNQDKIIQLAEQGLNKGLDVATKALGKGEPIEGADEDSVEGGDEGLSSEINRISYNLDRAKDLIRYNFRTAKIKYNLVNINRDIKSYGDDYNKILGEAIADSVDSTIKEKKKWVAEDYNDAGHVLNAAYTYLIGAPLNKTHEQAKKILKDVSDFAGREFDVKINTYRLAEAVDLYMKAFADGVSGNPEDIRDLVNILESTEVVSKWFTDKSGDLLCQVFDCFPASTVGAVARYNTHLNKNYGTGLDNYHYYLKVAAITQMGDLVALDASHPKFIRFDQAVLPGGWAAWFAAPYYGKPAAEFAHGRLNAIGVPAAANYNTYPGQPVMGLPISEDEKAGLDYTAGDMLKNLEKAMPTSMLKNIVAMFINVGKKFGENVLSKQTHFTPVQIYKHLLNYIIYGSVTFGRTAGVADLNITYSGNNYSPSTNNYEHNTFVTMRLIDSLKNQRAHNIFEETDKLFTMSIKSIVAKVLTTVGVYNMFNKPINKNGLGYKSNLRTIIGGGAPKVIPEALELYVRLPLLAEFYRELFKFTDNNKIINLIPEFDGIFSGLINLIFDKTKYVTSGEYSDLNVHVIIEEVNKIYNKFAGSKTAVTDAINEFVLEVNRRYGVITKQERDRYIKEKNERFDQKYEHQEEIVDYELEGLDESENDFRPAPSMSFQTESIPTSSIGSGRKKYTLDLQNNMNMVTALHTGLDDMFKKANPAAEDLETLRNTISFNPMILSSQEELKNAKSENEKYEVVRDAINSLGQFTLSNLEKNLLLFHEIVVHPLNNLKAIEKTLRAFETRVKDMSGVIRVLENFDLPVGGAVNMLAELFTLTAPVMTAAKVTNNELMRPYLHYPLPAVRTIANLVVGNEVCPNNMQGRGGGGGGGVNDYTSLYAAAQPNWANQKAKHLFQRFAINQDLLLNSLVETLFTHSAGFAGMVELKMDVKKSAQTDAINETCSIICYVDHSKLFQQVMETFNAVKNNIDRFRGLIPKNIIQKYEEYEANKASLYGIERSLILDLIQGKRTGGSGDVSTLDKVNTDIKNILDYLTKDWLVDGSNLGAGNLIRPVAVKNHQFTRMMDNLVYYDSNTIAADYPNASLNTRLGLATINDNDNLARLLFNTSGVIKKGVAPNEHWPGLIDGINPGPPAVDERVSIQAHRSLFDYTNTNYMRRMVDSRRRSVFILFNRLILAYLSNVYEHTVGRIYSTTIDKFANGPFSSAVSGTDNFNDNILIQETASIMALPAAEYKGVLWRTIAVMLRQLLTEMDSKGLKKQYLETDLNEIPLFVKERMRANLPVFHTLFKMLINKCEILKHFSKGLNNALSLPAVPIARTRTEHENDLVGMLDQIIQGSVAMIQCIKDTLNEISGDAKYLETYAGSIANYESENGKSPYMPLSSLSYALKDLDVAQVVTSDNTVVRPFLPENSVGQTKFKLLYASRKILEDAKMEDLPGMKDLLKNHNASADARHEIKEDEFNKLVLNNVQLSRGLLYFKHYTSVLTSFVDNDLAAGTNIANCRHHAYTNYYADIDTRSTLQLANGTSLEMVCSLTESSSQKENKGKVIDHIEALKAGECPRTKNRTQMLVYNIIDMNVVPVNVHALMREIPLINLINYSNTFDRMVEELYGLNSALAPALGDLMTVQDLAVNAAMLNREDIRKRPVKNLFGYMLKKPYTNIDDDVYNFYVAAIMRGSMGVSGLARPKYMSDDVFNKALFGELYPGKVYDEEDGPNAGYGHLRGKQEVLADQNILGDKYKQMVQRAIYAFIEHAPANTFFKGIYNLDHVGNTLKDLIRECVTTFAAQSGDDVNINFRSKLIDLLIRYFRIDNAPIYVAAGPNTHPSAWDVTGAYAAGAPIDPDASAKNNLLLPTALKTALNTNFFDGIFQAAADLVSNLVAARRSVTNVELRDIFKCAFNLQPNVALPIAVAGAGFIGRAAPITIDQATCRLAVRDILDYINARSVPVPVGGVPQKVVTGLDNLVNPLGGDYLLPNVAHPGAALANTNRVIDLPALLRQSYAVANTRRRANPLFIWVMIASYIATRKTVRKDIINHMKTMLPNFRGDIRQVIKNKANADTNLKNTGVVGLMHLLATTLAPAQNTFANAYVDPFVNVNNYVSTAYLGARLAELMTAKLHGTAATAALSQNLNPFPRGVADITALDTSVGFTAAQFPAAVGAAVGALPIADRDNIINDVYENNFNVNDFILLDPAGKNAIEDDNEAYFPKALHYLAKDGIKSVEFTNRQTVRNLQHIGKMRFDTILVRNLFWLTNIQRTLRLKLRRDLDWYDTKVVKDLSVASASITELYGNNVNEDKMENELN